jgi:hypothetical protein
MQLLLGRRTGKDGILLRAQDVPWFKCERLEISACYDNAFPLPINAQRWPLRY